MGGRTEVKNQDEENGEEIPMINLNLGKNVIKVPMVNSKSQALIHLIYQYFSSGGCHS